MSNWWIGLLAGAAGVGLVTYAIYNKQQKQAQQQAAEQQRQAAEQQRQRQAQQRIAAQRAAQQQRQQRQADAQAQLPQQSPQQQQAQPQQKQQPASQPPQIPQVVEGEQGTVIELFPPLSFGPYDGQLLKLLERGGVQIRKDGGSAQVINLEQLSKEGDPVQYLLNLANVTAGEPFEARVRTGPWLATAPDYAKEDLQKIMTILDRIETQLDSAVAT